MPVFSIYEFVRTYFTLVLTTFKVAFVSTTVSPLKRNSIFCGRVTTRKFVLPSPSLIYTLLHNETTTSSTTTTTTTTTANRNKSKADNTTQQQQEQQQQNFLMHSPTLCSDEETILPFKFYRKTSVMTKKKKKKKIDIGTEMIENRPPTTSTCRVLNPFCTLLIQLF